MKLQADNRVGAEEEVQGPCAGGDHFTPRPLQVVPPPYIQRVNYTGQRGWHGGGSMSIILTIGSKEPLGNHGPGKTGPSHKLKSRPTRSAPKWEEGPDTSRAGS